MATKNIKRFLIAFNHLENTNQNIRYRYIYPRKNIITKTDNTKCQCGYEETGILIHRW